MDYLTTHTSLSPIRRGFTSGFVNYKKGCNQLAAASDKVYQLLGHGRWFSPVTPASSTTKTGRHDIVEILLKVALNTINQINSKSNLILEFFCFTDQYFEYLDCDFFVLFVIFNFLFHQCCFLFPIIDIYFYLAVNSKLVFQTFKFNLPFNISTCRMV